MQPAIWMTNPSWFLVTGLPWPKDQPEAEAAEAAFAIAPSVTQLVRPMGPNGDPVPLGRGLTLMLDAGSRCAAALGKRVIFLSDITRWLAGICLSWDRIGVDFPTAQAELEHQHPGLFIMISRRAYTILCSTAGNLTMYTAEGSTAEIPPEERELARSRLEAALDADWPHYIAEALASAQSAA